MHTENEIWMRVPPERVFELVAEISRWPVLLPHYRWVRVLEERAGGRVAEMAARRGLFPVKWTSVQRLFPENGRICYHHISGITRGMDVEWRLTPRDGGTQVVIVHDLALAGRLLRTELAGWIIGHLFVEAIAGRTLHHLKEFGEKEAAATPQAEKKGNPNLRGQPDPGGSTGES